MALLRTGDKVVSREFSLTGFAELERALKRAPLKTMRKGAKQGLRSAANTPRKAMRAGLAAQGLTPTRTHGKTAPSGAIAIRNDPKAPVKRPAVYVGLVKDYFFLHINEVGSFNKPDGYGPRTKSVLRFKGSDGEMVYTKKRVPVPPKPWFTPSWFASYEATGQKIIDLMTKALDREFKKSQGAPK